MFQTRPWDGEGPALGRIPHDTRGGEASFKLDLFHCWKVGLGRDLTGSTIMYLALAGKFDDPLEPHEPRKRACETREGARKLPALVFGESQDCFLSFLHQIQHDGTRPCELPVVQCQGVGQYFGHPLAPLVFTGNATRPRTDLSCNAAVLEFCHSVL